MKMPTVQMVQVLCLIGFFAGSLQVLCLQKIPLDMAKNSVDDQYIGCNPKREQKLINSKKSPLPTTYNTIWEKAKKHWANLGQTVGNFNPIYGTAIVAYTIGKELSPDFNKAAKEAGKSQSSYGRYNFKDFHLLLTKALQAKKIKGKCYDVFRGISGTRYTVSNKAVVRFGQFASSSLDQKVAKRFAKDTFFSIKTCHGAHIEDFSYHKKEKEVLIPPYETFIVKGQSGGNITLESKGVFSRFNCEVLKGVGR